MLGDSIDICTITIVGELSQGDSYYHCIVILASLKTLVTGSLALRGGLSVVKLPLALASAVCVVGRHFATWQHPQLSYSLWKSQKVRVGATVASLPRIIAMVAYYLDMSTITILIKLAIIKLAIVTVIVPLSPSTTKKVTRPASGKRKGTLVRPRKNKNNF